MIRKVANYHEMVLPDAFSRLGGADKEEVQGTKVRVNELVDIGRRKSAKAAGGIR